MASILVIEDDLSAQKIYINKLKKEGYDVIIAGTGKEALFYSQERVPNLVILDLMLGGDDSGFQILENLKKDEKLKNIPVFVLTNLDNEEKIAKDIGASEYIIKSNIAIDDLVKKVKSYLN